MFAEDLKQKSTQWLERALKKNKTLPAFKWLVDLIKTELKRRGNK